VSPSNTGLTAFQGATYSGTVLTFNDANANASAGNFSVSINWGNGNVTSGLVAQLGGGAFQVTGSNTYGAAGTFPVAVTLNRPGGSSVVLNTSATVLAPLTGVTGNNGATSNPQPTFSGTAPAGATIGLQLLSTSGSGAGATGRAVADSSGHYTVQVTQALPDGTYAATANLVSNTGAMLSSINLGTVLIDTHGPAVASIAFTPANGQLSVTFQDPAGSGVNPAALANPGNYVLGIVTTRGVRNFGVAGLQLVPGSGGQYTAIVTYNLGRKPAAGKYVVTLHASGLTDRAGNPLQETHFVKFPQTSNAPDPDYIAQFNVNKHLGAAGPVVYVPASSRAAASRFGGLLRGLKAKRIK
jgi:hypothetical protein